VRLEYDASTAFAVSEPMNTRGPSVPSYVPATICQPVVTSAVEVVQAASTLARCTSTETFNDELAITSACRCPLDACLLASRLPPAEDDGRTQQIWVQAVRSLIELAAAMVTRSEVAPPKNRDDTVYASA
jgi:hypothetical protein